MFSLVNVLLGAGLVFEYVLENHNHKGHGLRAHSIFALCVGVVAFMTWIFELASFWSPYEVLFTAGIFNLVFVGSLCAWCIWLALFIFPHFDFTGDKEQQMEYI